MITAKYPLEFDTLNKGDVISTEQLRSIFGKEMLDATFAFAVLGLKDRIEAETDIVCRMGAVGIRLLTDLEADVYTVDQAYVGVKKLVKQAGRRSLIMRDEMTVDEKRAAESRDRMVIGIAAAAKRAMKKAHRISPDAPAAITDGNDDQG